MRKQRSILYWLIFSSLLFYFSCRKVDSEIPVLEKPFSIERFFNLPASANPKLKAIAQSIRTQEKEHPFLKDFTKRAGWPVWNKSKILGSSSRNDARGSDEDSSALIYIPFVQDTAIKVNAVLAVNMSVSDTSWKILYANNYESFGFDTSVNNTWNARNVFQFFAIFEYEIFGHTKFLIKDERLFNTPTDSFTVTLKSINDVSINSRTTDEYTMTICTIQTICPPAPPAPPPSTDQPARITDNCYTTSTCNTYNWGNGGTDWTGSSWSPNNSGGGSGSWGTTTSCMNTTTGTPIACTPGWEPYDNSFNSLPPYTIDLSGLNGYPCVQQIASDVVNLTNSTIKTIKDLFNESTKFNIKFSVDPTLTTAGNTHPSPFYYNGNNQQYGDFAYLNLTIRLNPTHLTNATKFSIAETIIHEMIHSYFYYRSIDAFGDPVKEQQLADELGFLKPHDPNASPSTYGNQHEQMAINFVDKIAAALKEYKLITNQDLQQMQVHYPSLDIDTYYKAMAWAGLTGDVNGFITKAWETFQTNNPTIADMYKVIITAEENATPLAASQEKC